MKVGPGSSRWLRSECEAALATMAEGKQALELEMRGRIKLSPSQFSAAKELLPYENAKLTAVAVGHFDGTSFAAQLERCLARSSSARDYVPRPALLPPAEQHPASELKGPFPMKRRNFR